VVRPVERRAVTRWMHEAYRVSLRKACRASGTAMSSMQYRPIRPDQTPLRERIKEIATTRVSYGYRRVQVLLRREGWKVNAKRTYRLYREEGLCLRLKRPKRRRSAARRQETVAATGANQLWAMDFMSDALSSGRRFRVLNVMDMLSREALAVEVDSSLPLTRVIQTLETIALERGYPMRISLDNEPELRRRALDRWAHERSVVLDFIQPGKPTQNPFIKSFNGKMRNEWLNAHWWRTIEEARQGNEEFRRIYNTVRPHRALGKKTPAEFAAATRSQLTPQAVGTYRARIWGTVMRLGSSGSNPRISE